eukprot:5369072-Pleurochrysis_carterae.AAC.5
MTDARQRLSSCLPRCASDVDKSNQALPAGQQRKHVRQIMTLRVAANEFVYFFRGRFDQACSQSSADSVLPPTCLRILKHSELTLNGALNLLRALRQAT